VKLPEAIGGATEEIRPGLLPAELVGAGMTGTGAIAAPLATARALVGSAVGAYGGGRVGEYLGGETGKTLGEIGGGLAGGIAGGMGKLILTRQGLMKLVFANGRDRLVPATPEEAAYFNNAASVERPPGWTPSPVMRRPSTLSEVQVGEGAEREPSSMGIRPSLSEERLTQLLRKPVLTPSEVNELKLAFGKDWMRLRGEGVIDMQNRLLGSTRARRAARGMSEPQP